MVDMQKDEYEVETDPYSEEGEEEEQKPRMIHEVINDMLKKRKGRDRMYLVEIAEG